MTARAVALFTGIGIAATIFAAAVSLLANNPTAAFRLWLAGASVFAVTAGLALADPGLLHALHLTAHWAFFAALAMACPVAASVALTGPLSAVTGVSAAAVVLLAGNTTTPRRRP